ncbi:hypothetical protein DIZ27_23115 [Streptomyces sp. NWU339]|uniref:hypothetical protein n=1 Tax=Streptomyces sp. NWU339 TaxID=2185284 RepID=UPI000D6822B4|nr:hypothetical protein [Streptomyces sp. NWU339]PWI08332.1 hypothetical protein DIZ27_23115 [Streptomyces sp. NWU339]
MAARSKSTPDETPQQATPEQPNAAVIRTQEYDAGEGWAVGQTAPQDAYRKLDAAGTGGPTGPVVHTHPGGYARQIVAKGQTITEGVRRELDAADESAAEGEQG